MESLPKSTMRFRNSIGMAAYRFSWAVCLLSSICAVCVLADDWPQWRGPRRDGISTETGLLSSWPEAGPPLVRTIAGMGEGNSSPIVAQGRLFITSHVAQEQRVTSFALDGTRLWQVANGSAENVRYGAQSSVVVEGDWVYVISETGRIVALAAGTGEKQWQRTFDELGGRTPKFAYAETVLISGDKLICQPGGLDASVVALDKQTGTTIWKSKGMQDTVAYCSAIVDEIHGIRQVVLVTEVGLVGLGEATGELLWRFDAPFNGARNCLTPVIWNNHVFAESGHRGAGAIVKITLSEGVFSAEPVWQSPDLPSHLGGYVGIAGKVYGHNGRGWGCRDMLTGEDAYRTNAIRNGSTIHCDNRFYCLDNTGTMYLVEADPQSCRIVSRFDIPNAGPRTWARPAIADGYLYLRREDRIFVYDVSAHPR